MNNKSKVLALILSIVLVMGTAFSVEAVDLSDLIKCSNGTCLIISDCNSECGLDNLSDCSQNQQGTVCAKNKDSKTESQKASTKNAKKKKNLKKKKAVHKKKTTKKCKNATNIKKKTAKKKKSTKKAQAKKKTGSSKNTTSNAKSSQKTPTSMVTTQPSGNEAVYATGSEEAQYVQQIVERVNQERVSAGLAKVTLDEVLTEAAMKRAWETVTSFSHTRPDGSSFSTVLSEYGISYRGAGENIAWGQTSPQEVMTGWMNSAGHRANILNAAYKKIGVGYYKAANGRKYWSQLFIY